MNHPLHDQLVRVRDRLADVGEVASVRREVVAAGLLDDIPGVMEGEEAAEDAGLLLALWDETGPGSSLGEAVAWGGAAPDLSDGILSALFGDDTRLSATGGVSGAVTPAIGDAVRSAAGALPDVVASVVGVGLPVASAVGDAAGAVPEVAAAFADVPPVGDAVRDAAGAFADVADAVMASLAADDDEANAWPSAMLDHELAPADHRAAAGRLLAEPSQGAWITRSAEIGREIVSAVRAEAGAGPSVWPQVAAAIGLADPEHVPGWVDGRLAEAVRAEAGTVDVRPVVMASVRPPDLVRGEIVEEAAANHQGWGAWAAMAALAAAMLVVVLPPLITPVDDPAALVPVAQFAAVGEVNVDALSYAERASVFVEVPVDKETPLIIWVDEGGGL